MGVRWIMPLFLCCLVEMLGSRLLFYFPRVFFLEVLKVPVKNNMIGPFGSRTVRRQIVLKKKCDVCTVVVVLTDQCSKHVLSRLVRYAVGQRKLPAKSV